MSRTRPRRPVAAMAGTAVLALVLSGMMVLGLHSDLPAVPHPAVACSVVPPPRDVIGLLRRSPRVALVSEVNLGEPSGDEQSVSLHVERWIAGGADRETIETQQSTIYGVQSNCGGSGLRFKEGGRYVVFMSDDFYPDFEGGYEVIPGGLVPNGTWSAPRDLVGISEFTAIQRIDAAARFIAGEGATYYGRGPSEQLLWLPLPDQVPADGRPKLYTLPKGARWIFVGTVVDSSVDEGYQGVPVTRLTLQVESELKDRTSDLPELVRLEQYGAMVGRWRLEAESEPIMQRGERYLVFCRWCAAEGGETFEQYGDSRFRVVGERVQAVTPDWLAVAAVDDLDGLTVDEAAAKIRQELVR